MGLAQKVAIRPKQALRGENCAPLLGVHFAELISLGELLDFFVAMISIN